VTQVTGHFGRQGYTWGVDARRDCGRGLLSRTQASKQWQGRKLIDELRERGVLIRTRSYRGVAEEAPGAYKDVNVVAKVAEQAGLARRVARLVPLICVKG